MYVNRGSVLSMLCVTILTMAVITSTDGAEKKSKCSPDSCKSPLTCFDNSTCGCDPPSHKLGDTCVDCVMDEHCSADRNEICLANHTCGCNETTHWDLGGDSGCMDICVVCKNSNVKSRCNTPQTLAYCSRCPDKISCAPTQICLDDSTCGCDPQLHKYKLGKTCVECLEDTHCDSALHKTCQKNNVCDCEPEFEDEDGQCVECVKNEHCPGRNEICLADTHTCGCDETKTSHFRFPSPKGCVECLDNTTCDSTVYEYCQDGVCDCLEKFKVRGHCVNEHLCTTDAECTEKYTTCKGFMCVCNDGFVMMKNGTCVEGDCLEDTECDTGIHKTCRNNTCDCDSKYKIDRQCFECKEDTDCNSTLLHETCKSNKCDCEEEYQDDNKKCVQCKKNDHCPTDRNEICLTDHTCGCNLTSHLRFTSAKGCVECVTNDHCSANRSEICLADHTCGCDETTDLKVLSPKGCVECLKDTHCESAEHKTCQKNHVCDCYKVDGIGKCVECLEDTHCDPALHKKCQKNNVCDCEPEFKDEDGQCVAEVVKPVVKPIEGKVATTVEVTTVPPNNSTHFAAYLLVAVVLCIVGYVGYHNRTKLMGLVLEGSNGKRKARDRKHKNVDYAPLEENVAETLSKGSGKTYIY